MKDELVPWLEEREELALGHRVGLGEDRERAFLERHPEAEGLAGGVALDHLDTPLGVVALGQSGEVEPARSAADHRDVHEPRPYTAPCTAGRPPVCKSCGVQGGNAGVEGAT